MSRRLLVGFAIVEALIVAACGASPGASQVGATAPAAPPPSVAEEPQQRNELVDIGGGRKLHLFCFGEASPGMPTVVAEGGLGAGSGAFPPEILYGVAEQTRFCAYDRAGLGTSDPAPEAVRTSKDMADDLDALLTAAHIDRPYVFVTHSMGIWNLVLYAKAHPENVLGVVAVDPRGAEVSAQWLAALPAEAADEAEGIALMREDLTGFETDPTANDDHLDLVAASLEAVAAMEPPDLLFGDKPVVVLSAANSPDNWSDLPASLKPEFDQIWFDAQKAVAAESSNGTVMTVEDSGHGIQDEQPQAVLTQILDVLARTAE